MTLFKNTAMRIFLVDDDADDRELFKLALYKVNAECSLTLFTGGREVIAHLGNPENELPHILFLDLNMPAYSGFECLHEITRQPALRSVSVAIYSSSKSEEDIEATLSAGANIYIEKPDDFAKLQEALRYVIKINWQFHSCGLDKETFFLSI